MAEQVLKVKLDTTEIVELIDKTKREFAERQTVQSAMDFISNNEEYIKYQLGEGINEYRLAEVLTDYARSLVG